MSLNQTPRGDRVHISIFGKTNAGKSSIINAITNQELAIVSDKKGTTTDPVYKAMELLPLGPVMVIDTPGLDDEGELGEKRISKAIHVLNKTDIALIIVDAKEFIEYKDEKLKKEYEIIKMIEKRKIPYIIVYNKKDLLKEAEQDLLKNEQAILVSAKTKEGIFELKELIAKQIPEEQGRYPIVKDLLQTGDFVILVVPIDKAAPKGRLILPQQQTIREILEVGATAIVVQDTELENTLQQIGKKPRIVITDSQVFEKVNKIVPQEIPLTSFSILFARHKGNLFFLMEQVKKIEQLKDGDRVLISEGCTHHRQCDDIGTVKIPKWLKSYTGKDIIFETSSGTGFPVDLTKYSVVIHCGGCTLNEKEMQYRISLAKEQNVPMVNYGVLISFLNGILDRAVKPLKDV